MDLFSAAAEAQRQREAPLAARMRPRSLEEFLGQTEVVGEGRLLRRSIQADRLWQDHFGHDYCWYNQIPLCDLKCGYQRRAGYPAGDCRG